MSQSLFPNHYLPNTFYRLSISFDVLKSTYKKILPNNPRISTSTKGTTRFRSKLYHL